MWLLASVCRGQRWDPFIMGSSVRRGHPRARAPGQWSQVGTLHSLLAVTGPGHCDVCSPVPGATRQAQCRLGWLPAAIQCFLSVGAVCWFQGGVRAGWGTQAAPVLPWLSQSLWVPSSVWAGNTGPPHQAVRWKKGQVPCSINLKLWTQVGLNFDTWPSVEPK